MKDDLIKFLKRILNRRSINRLKDANNHALRALGFVMYPYARFVGTPLNLVKNKRKDERRLEIGPGPRRIPGFETINVVWGRDVDYICDASKKLPFETATFDLIYASHILEHTPWYGLADTLAEWIRVLKPGGVIEIWVPDSYKVSKLLCDIEEGKERGEWHDGWRPLNPENNPYKWINGRILYGARKDYPSWHVAMITPKSLELLLKDLGIVNILRLESEDVRGVDHGWINLGIRGYKP